MGFLATIGSAIADKLVPIVVATLEKQGAVLIPKVGDTIAAEIEKRIPTVIHAVVIAITETLGKAAEQGIDKVTDLIPGQLDDQLLDPIMARVNELLKGL